MERVNLNFGWRFAADFDTDYISTDFNDDNFETVNIPHTNKVLDYNNFGEGDYQFISCYRKAVFIPDDYSGKSVTLKFEGVASYAGVYVNGEFAGEHFGGYTPFDINISDKIRYGNTNILVVSCDSTERTDIPPFGNVMDYIAYGGIYREVWLEVKDKRNIRDVFVRTYNVLEPHKTLDMDIELSYAMPGLKLQIQVISYREEIVSSFSYVLGSSPKVNIKGKVLNVHLWDLNTPVLYTLKVQLLEGDTLIDEDFRRFGFRQIAFLPDGFYLNGKRIKLTGLNRHQSYPYVGYAMPRSAQQKDADILKYDLGVNIVRTSHYPQSRHFLDRCDEIGLMVFEEIPGWQHIGEGKWIEVACNNVREMVLRDRNHPCIVLWGVRINESPDCNDFYRVTNRIAHELDNTRPTGGVRNFKNSNLLEDVYTYNDFIHTGHNPALKQPGKVVKEHVPYLVTEYNGHMFPTKRFDNEGIRMEHALRHMRVIDSMMGNPGISGCIGWCAFDYNTHRDFGSGDRICYHGVGDMFRIPKPAWYVYASQQDSFPVLEIPSSMDIGEHPAGDLGTIYAFTNCDLIKLYKNDDLIKVYYPNKKQFPNLKHPPVKIDDLIGNQLQKNENIGEKDAGRFKKVLKDVSKYGFNLPISSKLMMGRLMLKYKLSIEDGMRIFGTYINNWGGQRVTFRFEGYKDGQLVRTVTKAPAETFDMELIPDSRILCEKDTYDVTRIVLKAVDKYGNLLTYSNDAVTIELDGPVRLIGPKCISLIGGARAFWVKSEGKSGIACVSVISEKFGTKKIEIEVQKRY